jgi:hypothetical protein
MGNIGKKMTQQMAERLPGLGIQLTAMRTKFVVNGVAAIKAISFVTQMMAAHNSDRPKILIIQLSKSV